MIQIYLYRISILLFLLSIQLGGATTCLASLNRDSLYTIVLVDRNTPAQTLESLVLKGADGFILNSPEVLLPADFINKKPLFLLSQDRPLNYDKTFRWLPLDSLTIINGFERANFQDGSVYNDCRKANYILSLFDSDSIESRVIDIWQNSGRVCNFIVTQPSTLPQTAQTVARINKMKRVRIKVALGESSLDDVYWKQIPKLITDGAFSYPLDNSSGSIFSPVKPGYSFSPDIISFNSLNMKSEKVFRAVPMKITDNLIESQFFFSNWLGFEKKGWKFQDVEVSKTDKGRTAFFDGKSSYIDCGDDSRFDFTEPFSLSVWVNLNETTTDKSIIGKGFTFSLKIMDSNPTFTLVGHNDFQVEDQVLEVDRWYHLGFVYTESGMVKLFVDGEIVGEYSLGDNKIEKCDYSIMIGSNVWDEYFDGEMSQLSLWSREISEKEMRLAYSNLDLNRGVKDLSNPILAIIFLSLVLLSIATVIYSKRLIRVIKYNKIAELPDGEVTTDRVKRNKIILFGNFIVLNDQGEDIAHKFSPMLKHIFLVTLFYSYGDKNREGVNTARLTSYIWPHLTAQQAKNTRGTNMRKLRDLLSEISGIDLLFEDKKWSIKIDSPLVCDFKEVSGQLINKSAESFLNSKKREDILAFIKQGRLTPMVKEEWFEIMADKFYSALLDRCESLIPLLKAENARYIGPLLADAIFAIDPLNEDGLLLKVRSLVSMGKHSLAKGSYDSFSNDYKELYGESFKISYNEIIRSSL